MKHPFPETFRVMNVVTKLKPIESLTAVSYELFDLNELVETNSIPTQEKAHLLENMVDKKSGRYSTVSMQS